MNTTIQAILGASLSSLLGLVGGFLMLAQYQGVKRWSGLFVSFAAGALLGAAFFDLIPEAIGAFPGRLQPLFAWLIAGFLFFFLIEKYLLWHHHAHGEPADESARHNKALVPLIVVGDAIHNFIDGSVVAAAFLVNPALGVTTALAVLAHEIPQEIGDFSILVHGGMRRRAVAWWNILGALISPLGAVFTLILAGTVEAIELPLLGLAAGMFIYIAAADLVPEIHRQKKLSSTIIQLVLLVAGLLAIVWIGSLFPHR